MSNYIFDQMIDFNAIQNNIKNLIFCIIVSCLIKKQKILLSIIK